MNSESGVLIGDDIVLVLGIDRLEVRRDVNVVVGEFGVLAELFEEVGVEGVVEMDVGVVGVFIHAGVSDPESSNRPTSLGGLNLEVLHLEHLRDIRQRNYLAGCAAVELPGTGARRVRGVAVGIRALELRGYIRFVIVVVAVGVTGFGVVADPVEQKITLCLRSAV